MSFLSSFLPLPPSSQVSLKRTRSLFPHTGRPDSGGMRGEGSGMVRSGADSAPPVSELKRILVKGDCV